VWHSGTKAFSLSDGVDALGCSIKSPLKKILMVEAAIENAIRLLTELQDAWAEVNAMASPEFITRLSVTIVHQKLHLDFYGDAMEEPFQQLLDVVVQPEVASHLCSLKIGGPDEGANGTRNWDLTKLVDGEVIYPQLRLFKVEQNKSTDHNRTIVASVYDEDGVLGTLLSKSPNLEQLTTPSAPSANFFKAGHRPLRYLNVDAGFATQCFISNLAECSFFPDLTCLEFGEYNETYMDDYALQCTPFEDYLKLFQSIAFRSVRSFIWRNPVCTQEQIKQLKSLNPQLQMLIVRSTANYV
jgi:hypothetical protein